MSDKIQIVDRGRGPQLSTSRITVQDLVPYFQEGVSGAEIIRWIPTLSAEEIAIVHAYYREHQAELDEQDRRIRIRSAQAKNPPEVEEILRRGGERMAALKEEFANKKNHAERIGDHASG
ncbi:MAG: DUF433 domain-containing protein [Planctomycetes bacterium]|nr:DUF433 domain-containing protein [Planctomycetota bacterium]